MTATAEARALADARYRAHRWFDLLWMKYRMGRDRAYRFLANAMGLTYEEAHIGRLSIEQCEKLIAVVRRVVPEGRFDELPPVPYPYCLSNR